jgi:hypothetical protein
MKHRTALKTRRTGAPQSEALPPRAFTDYVTMVERFSAGYFRPLRLRQSALKRAH